MVVVVVVVVDDRKPAFRYGGHSSDNVTGPVGRDKSRTVRAYYYWPYGSTIFI